MIDSSSASASVIIGNVSRPKSQKSVADAYLCAFPLGFLGLHRFYLGQPLLGLAYLFSGGFFGVGWLHDMLMMPKIVQRVNHRLANPQISKEFSLLEAYVLCLNPGGLLFGLHQFYLGRKGFGTAYCFTASFATIGWFLDIFRMPLLVADARQRVHESEESPVAAMKKRPKRLDDAYVMWVFGFLGVHHFYLGNIGFGFAYLFTIGMGGVGWLVDFFRMPVLVRRANTHPPSPFKHLDSAYVLTFPLGFLGLQHFYLGKPGLGLTYLLTFGLVGIGFLADIIRMPFVVREINESIAADQLITVTVDENTENQSVNSNINSLQATNIPYQSPQPPTDLPNEQAKSLLITETSADTINAAAAPPQHHLPEPYGPPPAYQSIVDDNTPEIPRRK